MISVKSDQKPTDKNFFPRLMVGKSTGTIYLVTQGVNSHYNTIVLEPKDIDQEIGDSKPYHYNLLEDFKGEVTLRNM